MGAERTPVVLLCLGADVEISFWHKGYASAAAVPISAPVVETGFNGVGGPDILDGEEDSLADVDSDYRAPKKPATKPANGKVKKTKKAKPAKLKQAEEVLMITLVHGDMLVFQGGVFDVSIRGLF